MSLAQLEAELDGCSVSKDSGAGGLGGRGAGGLCTVSGGCAVFLLRFSS